MDRWLDTTGSRMDVHQPQGYVEEMVTCTNKYACNICGNIVWVVRCIHDRGLVSLKSILNVLKSDGSCAFAMLVNTSH